MMPGNLNASSASMPVGTGGFLHPESIVGEFDITEGMSIADFGCGAGYFTLILAERTGPTGKVYALDILENSLDNVRAKARAAGIENIEVIKTNLEILGSSSLMNDSQDMVLMANILFQSNKRADVIREGKRIIKPGGKLVIIDWKKGNGLFGPPDGVRPDKDELKQTAEKEGFVLKKEMNAGSFHFGFIFTKS